METNSHQDSSDPQIVPGKVVVGHGVASGSAGDPRFPKGTLGLQWDLFEARGLQLDGFFRGTINVSVAPLIPVPVRAQHTFRDVKWHADCPPEDFSFFDLRISVGSAAFVPACIYWPHPETKPEHFQDPHVVEVLAPLIDGVRTGDAVRLAVDPQRMKFTSSC